MLAPIATFFALFSHIAAGGQMPGLIGVCAPLFFSVAACHFVTLRSLSIPALTLAVAVCQFLFHSLFNLGTSSMGASVAALPPGMATASERAMHSMHAPGHAAAAEGSASAVFSTASVNHHDSAMLVAHVVAGLITVAALHHGELITLAVIALASFVWLCITRPAAQALITNTRGRRFGLVSQWPVPHSFGVFVSAASRRGPPMLCSRLAVDSAV